MCVNVNVSVCVSECECLVRMCVEENMLAMEHACMATRSGQVGLAPGSVGMSAGRSDSVRSPDTHGVVMRMRIC